MEVITALVLLNGFWLWRERLFSLSRRQYRHAIWHILRYVRSRREIIFWLYHLINVELSANAHDFHRGKMTNVITFFRIRFIAECRWYHITTKNISNTNHNLSGRPNSLLSHSIPSIFIFRCIHLFVYSFVALLCQTINIFRKGKSLNVRNVCTTFLFVGCPLIFVWPDSINRQHSHAEEEMQTI